MVYLLTCMLHLQMTSPTYSILVIVLYMIRNEMLHFVHMRHQFLISKAHSRLPQARTVLITACPDELANEHDLRQFCAFVPGGIDRVWILRDTRTLNDMYEAREDACDKLEVAEAKVLHHSATAWRKKEKAYDLERKLKHKRKKDEEKHEEEDREDLELPPASLELLNELVPATARPTHRIGFLGLFGQKVDTIEWCRKEIGRLNVEIRDAREHIVKGKFLGSVFVRCNLQMGAHILAQAVSYHEVCFLPLPTFMPLTCSSQPLVMYDKWMEANPLDIVWRNLDDGALEMRSRFVLSWAATLGLIIAWGFPVGFIGVLSNLTELCAKVRWLGWVCRGGLEFSFAVINY